MYSSVLKPADNRAAAFNEFALQHLDALYRYAMSLTHNDAESQDLVQETYLRALRASGRLRPDSNVKSWLFKILRNVRLNEVQRRPVNSQSIDLDKNFASVTHPAGSASANPDISYASAMKEAAVRAAVDNLTPSHREIIVLRKFENLSYGEIAQVLNCRLGTVMSRLARARERLEDLLSCWNERGGKSSSQTEERL